VNINWADIAAKVNSLTQVIATNYIKIYKVSACQQPNYYYNLSRDGSSVKLLKIVNLKKNYLTKFKSSLCTWCLKQET